MFRWILLIISGILCEQLKELNMNLDFKDISKAKAIDELSSEYGDTVEEFDKMNAGFDDAQHRGSSWYSFRTSDSAYNSDGDMGVSATSSIEDSDSVDTISESTDASSQDTTEKRKATRLYRECTPCPTDMLKSHKNLGIKWICASYQRARRSFKSECMMRYRNCQDGTMFVKIYEHRCKNDTFHGRHWFYVYKV